MMIRNVESRNILQGLFNKWQGKDKEVINEAKVEDVQTTIIAQPPKLYQLNFRRSDACDDRWRVSFKGINVCNCYAYEKEQVENDFNKYKLGGYSTKETIEALKEKYNRKHIREYNFYKSGKKTLLFSYTFENKLHPVCSCKNHHKTKEKVLNHCRDLVGQGKSLEEIREIMRPIYSSKKRKQKIKQQKTEEKKQDNLRWSDNGELLFNGLHSGLLPSNVAMIQTLHANHTNPFIFADYVCQNLPEARPSVINYICMNYDKIPFNDLIKEGMEIIDKQRGF